MQDWQERAVAEQPVLRGRQSADAVVIGGGLSGMTTALWLCRAGLRVILLEAGRVGGGATAGCAGMVSLCRRLQYTDLEKNRGLGVASAYAQTQMQALHSISQLAGQAEWRPTAAQTVGQEEAAMEREQAAMRRAGLTAEVTRSTQCPLPAAAAVTMQGMATLNPMAYLTHMQKQAQKLGLKIYEHSRVTAMETNLAITQRGSVQAPYIVVATGYPIVNIPGWYFLRLTQRRQRLTALIGGGEFDGMYYAADGSYALRRRQEGVLLREDGGAVGFPTREEALPTLLSSVSGCRVLGHTDALVTRTPDGLPYIGPYSRKTPNLFVMTGYQDNGILMSMVGAQAISARVLGLPDDAYQIYSGQRLRGSARAALAALGRYAGSLAARPSAPSCPHLGCKLVYDRQARIWSCPCHGSRFDDIGRILNAPAVHAARLNRRK